MLCLFLVFILILSSAGVQAGAAGITVTDDIAALDLGELDALIAELDGLAAQCKARNINCDYETVKIAVLKNTRPSSRRTRRTTTPSS